MSEEIIDAARDEIRRLASEMIAADPFLSQLVEAYTAQNPFGSSVGIRNRADHPSEWMPVELLDLIPVAEAEYQATGHFRLLVALPPDDPRNLLGPPTRLTWIGLDDPAVFERVAEGLVTVARIVLEREHARKPDA